MNWSGRNYKYILAGLAGCGGLLLAACGHDNTATPTAVSSGPLAPLSPPVGVNAPPPTVPLSPTPAVTPSLAAPATPVPAPKATTPPLRSLPGVAGEIPAPPEAHRLNLTLPMLQRLQPRLGGRLASVDLSRLQTAAYAAATQPVDLFDYYRAAMPAKGWSESRLYDNRVGIYFVKENQVAAVSVTGVPDDLTVTFLARFVPEVQGQLKGGESLILLGQGPSATFEVLKK